MPLLHSLKLWLCLIFTSNSLHHNRSPLIKKLLYNCLCFLHLWPLSPAETPSEQEGKQVPQVAAAALKFFKTSVTADLMPLPQQTESEAGSALEEYLECAGGMPL